MNTSKVFRSLSIALLCALTLAGLQQNIFAQSAPSTAR